MSGSNNSLNGAEVVNISLCRWPTKVQWLIIILLTASLVRLGFLPLRWWDCVLLSPMIIAFMYLWNALPLVVFVTIKADQCLRTVRSQGSVLEDVIIPTSRIDQTGAQMVGMWWTTTMHCYRGNLIIKPQGPDGFDLSFENPPYGGTARAFIGLYAPSLFGKLFR